MTNNLPKNWASATIEEIAIRITDGTHQTPNYAKDGIRFISTTNIKPFSPDFDFSEYSRYISTEDHKELTKRCCPTKGDILISKCGTIGRVKQVDVDYPFSIFVGLALIKLYEGIFVDGFLDYLLNSPPVQKAFIKAAPGSTRKTLTLGSIKWIRIPIPPFEEQKRIIVKIEELFTDLNASIEALVKSKALIKKYRKSVLKAAFEGKLTEVWRNKHKTTLEPANSLLEKIKSARVETANLRVKALPPIDASSLPTLPKVWVWARVGEVIQIIDYRGRTPPYSNEGIPHLRSANIKSGKVVWENLRYVSEGTYLKYMTRGLPGKKDLLFTTEAPLGEVAFAPDCKFSIAQRMMLLRPDQTVFEPEYLKYLIMSSHFQGRLSGKGTGTTVSGVSSRNFKPLELPIPSMPEQLKIIEEIEYHLSISDSAEKIVDTGLKQAERLRQSILKKAFEGRLAPQDPNDEPAKTLLERITSQKAKAEVSNNKVFKKKVSK